MSKKISCIIVEDEPLARGGLESYVNDVDFLELKALCSDAVEANNALSVHQPHLMFLDIQMPRLSGIDFLKSLKTPPMVIFTTAFPNYALQGFELDVVDYLVKPYPFERFLKAVNKARDFFSLLHKNLESDTRTSDYFFVKSDNKLEKVVISEIIYVEAMENYVMIKTTRQKIMTLMTMKSIGEILPASQFLRVHKSFIVNIGSIQSIEGNQINVENYKIPLSRQKKQELLDRIVK